MAVWVLDPTVRTASDMKIVVWKDDEMFSRIIPEAIAVDKPQSYPKSQLLQKLRRECPEYTLVLSSELDEDETPRPGRLFTPSKLGHNIDPTELAKDIFRARQPYRSVWLLDVIDKTIAGSELKDMVLRLWREVIAIEEILLLNPMAGDSERGEPHYLALYTKLEDVPRKEVAELMSEWSAESRTWPGEQTGLKKDVHSDQTEDDTLELFGKIKAWLG